jgi:hypothetical protein
VRNHSILVRVAGGGLLFVIAALLRPMGVAAVLPFMIAASALWIDAALAAMGETGSYLWKATFAAFGVRWGLAIALYCASLYQWPLGRSLQVGNGFWLFCMDSLNYHSWGPPIMRALLWDLPLPNPGVTIDYYLVVAMTYALFGTSPLTAIAFNILAWTLAVVGLIAVFARLRGRALPAALVVVLSFWPSGLIWPTQLMKDSLVLLSLVLAVGAGVLLIESGRARRGLASAALLWLALIPLLRLRIYFGRVLFAAVLTAMAAGVLLWIAQRARWRSIALAAAVAAIAHVGLATITVPDPFVVLAPADPAYAYLRFAEALRAQGEFNEARSAHEKARTIDPTIALTEGSAEGSARSHAPTPVSMDAPPVFVVVRALGRMTMALGVAVVSTPLWSSADFTAMSPDQLGLMRQKFGAEDGAGGVRARLRNWNDAMRLIPPSMATALFAPFPWDVLRPRGITGQFRTLAVSESLLMFALLPAIALGFTRLRRAEEIFVAAIALGGLLVMSLVITNLGTFFRLRAPFTLIFVAFAMYGFDVYAWAASLVRPVRRGTSVER